MEIVVVGCGRVGAELANRLFLRGHKVTVVDRSSASFQNLRPDFRGRTIEGEALNQDVLRRAGLERADGFAAVTSSDTLNTVVAHIARTVYNTPNVVVRNYDSRARALLEAFDLQIVSSTSWGAQRIEELLYHRELRSVFSAGNGEVEIYEITVPAAWEGRSLQELLPGEECVVSALTRAGKAILPDRETVLQVGDVVLVSATFDGVEALRRRLKLGEES
jgi:trk system potassium uptake protein TrkA